MKEQSELLPARIKPKITIHEGEIITPTLLHPLIRYVTHISLESGESDVPDSNQNQFHPELIHLDEELMLFRLYKNQPSSK